MIILILIRYSSYYLFIHIYFEFLLKHIFKNLLFPLKFIKLFGAFAPVCSVV